MVEKMTRADFMKSMEQDDACYIYYTDKNHIMHFISDNAADDVADSACFTTNLNNALLMHIADAAKIKILCDVLFDNHVHHIVRMHSRVEWV